MLDDSVGYCFLDGAVPFELTDCVEGLSNEDSAVLGLAHAAVIHHGDAAQVAGWAENVDVFVGEAAVFAEGESLGDEACRELVTCVSGVVVGGDVEEMVGSGTVGEESFRGEEVVVEGKVPPFVDILGVSDLNLIVLVEGSVVAEDCIGLLYLIEIDVVGSLIESGEDVRPVCERGAAVESGEGGEVWVAELGDSEVVIAIKAVENIVELSTRGVEVGVSDFEDFYFKRPAVKEKDRAL